MISLATPFTAYVDNGPPDPSIVASSLLSHVDSTSCYLSVQPMSQALSPPVGVSSTPFSQNQRIQITSALTPSLPSGPASLSQPTAATANTSYPQHTQSASVTTGETKNLIIGLVVAIVAVMLFASIGLAYFCIFQKRRRKRDETAKIDRERNNSDGEGENPHMYLQQKVELDDEQRRHEMEAAELRYEVQGVDEIHEMPADEGDSRYGRHELNGDDCSTGVDMARRNSLSQDE